MKRPDAPIGQPDATGDRNLSVNASATSASAPAASINREQLQSKAQAFAHKLADERRHAAWLNGFRFSAFSLIMAGVLVVGVLSLIPRIQELVSQRQQIQALQADISATKADIAAKEAERAQWNDESFIETQARERLYFVQPGDVSYLLINDLTPAQLTAQNAQAATTEVVQAQDSWLGSLLGSVWSAGAATVLPTSSPEPTQ